MTSNKSRKTNFQRTGKCILFKFSRIVRITDRRIGHELTITTNHSSTDQSCRSILQSSVIYSPKIRHDTKHEAERTSRLRITPIIEVPRICGLHWLHGYVKNSKSSRFIASQISGHDCNVAQSSGAVDLQKYWKSRAHIKRALICSRLGGGTLYAEAKLIEVD